MMLKSENIQFNSIIMNISEYLILSTPLYLQDKCGYCHGEKSVEESTTIKSWIPYNENHKESKTIGFQVESITIEQYEELINLNFRRSGTFIYKCDNLRNCCFYHTIRTNLKYLKLNKELRNDLNKFNTVIGMGKNEGKVFDINIELEKILKSNDFSIRFEDKNENFDQKYELFKEYQNVIHNDKVNKNSFKRFLIKNPFPEDGKIEDFKLVKYGSIQLCYYFKNELIGVSFLDILPIGISSIYFIYDHKFATEHKLSMGKISILIELLMLKKLDLKYLYLGYFIKDCIKMKYKSKFGGEILNFDFNWEEISDETFKEFDRKLEEKYGYGKLKINEIQELEKEGYEFDKSLNLFKLNDEKFDHPYELPIFLINSIPINKILEKLSENPQIKIFIQGKLIEIEFNNLTSNYKKIVFNVLRLIGLNIKFILYVPG